jgi:ADP-heptose:LPS heptosyltransferase
MFYDSMRQFLKRAFLLLRRVSLPILFSLRKLRRERSCPSDPRGILVLSQQRLGDAVLSLPLFPALKGRFPRASVSVLANAAIGEIFELCPDVEQVFCRDQGAKRKGIFRLIREIRKNQFDIVIDLNTDGSLFFGLVAGFSDGKYTVGYSQDGRGVFFDAALPDPPEGAHTVEQVLATLLPLGVEGASREVVLPLPERERETRPFFLQRNEEDCWSIVGIHPGATHWTQQWPLEYYAVLADELIADGTARVILCGGPDDWEGIRKIQERMRQKPEIAPPLPSLTAFATFLSELDLLVCNNSGPLHLACAVGTRTVSFMGPTRSAQWWPAGEGHTVFRRHQLPCIGCNKGYCRIKTHECLRGILPSEVYEICREKLTDDEEVRIRRVASRDLS